MKGRCGQYQLLDRIGAGGMAEVFRARRVPDGTTAKIVAVKRIRPHIASMDHFISMFVDEAKIAAQLSHPNIIKIVDVGLDEGEYFIAMEYIRGIDVQSLLERCKGQDLRVPVSLTCTIVARVCDALSYAHNKLDDRERPMRVVHRDVTPANVLLSYEGEIKLIDFGVAKAANRLVRTQTGMLKGKMSYLAPELLAGAKADHRADVFAAGIVLWEMLTGARLFDGASDLSTLELVRACKVAPPSSINPDVPPELDRIVTRALAREPAKRFQDAIELHDALQDFVGLATPGWTAGRISGWLEVADDEPAIEVEEEVGTAIKTRLFQRAPLAPACVVVNFDSAPRGATVYLLSNGARGKVGTTPVAIELPRGTACDVSLRKPGYSAWTDTLDLTGSDSLDVLAVLEEARTASGDESGLVMRTPPGSQRDIATEPGTVDVKRPAARLSFVVVLLATVLAASLIRAPELWLGVWRLI